MRKFAANINFPHPQLGLFAPNQPVKKAEVKRQLHYYDLSIHEKINLKYNHSFIMNFLRDAVRAKKGWGIYFLDRYLLKQTVGIGSSIKMCWKPERYSVKTTMWLRLGFIDSKSSLAEKYGKPVTWEIIVADSAKKKQEKKQKKLNLK